MLENYEENKYAQSQGRRNVGQGDLSSHFENRGVGGGREVGAEPLLAKCLYIIKGLETVQTAIGNKAQLTLAYL